MSKMDDHVDAEICGDTSKEKSAVEEFESGYQSGAVVEAVASMSLSENELSTLNETEEPRYEMPETKKRGRLLLFCNKTFQGLPERQGSEKDVAVIQEVFGQILKFDIETHYDMSALGMYLAIKQECDTVDHSQEDCFAVIILSHGAANGVIYGSSTEKEDKTTIDKLAEPVQQCKTLVGKPKLFFVQACRGEKLNESLRMQSDGTETGSGVSTLPETADFLFAYSTVEGYYSFRNKTTGSWFIQTLCAQFKDNWQKLEIIQMLTRVCRQMTTLTSRFTAVELLHFNNRQQVSSVTTTLTKALYFTPKSPSR